MTAIPKFFRLGQNLFKEGEPSRCMYLVKKGTVAVRKMKGGSQIEIAKIYSNEVIGELSFFDRMPRSASAVAMTDVEVLEISFESLDKIYSRVPDYMKSIMAAVAERLRKSNELVRRLQKNTVGDDEAPAGAAPKDEPDTASILAATEENKPADAVSSEPGSPGSEETAADSKSEPESKK